MSRYYDDKGNIRKELLSDEAIALAESFVNPQRGEKELNSSQLRRFYGEFKSIEKKLEFKSRSDKEENAFLSILPLIKMVRSKVAYACPAPPGKPKIPGSFAKWLSDNVIAIESVKDFKTFLLYFEAVVGFCYGVGMKDS
ncbi:type III-A CRISPR-associated protein Csm2 [Desulfolutivibrio sulfoxidireducens]|uniref:type III-A CRISPR-associated protein Csm2 n=1 Tax=Desulfolutivibrio sulfoxidireducens TaxID=2773299 RepID=UPI00159DE389|nr:type III-A CRISPR-associated protein Csm2 [Desulfolutivibrio sulfoxidireducens]QLA19331.1 type III-A CRISPR-associated protein Csm2 [Desulfolutivibrio sulfoxidireducens]